MPHASLGPTSPLVFFQLHGRLRRELRLFRKITGLTAVTSLATFPPESGTEFLLAPPVHPQCARRIRRLGSTPCGDQWLTHLRASRRSPRAHQHVCPIGLRCTCVPIHFGDQLVGVAKLVAPPTTSDSAFEAGMGVLKLVVSETCMKLAISGLNEQVQELQRRVAALDKLERGRHAAGADAARRKDPPGANDVERQSILLVNRALAYLQSHYQTPTLSLSELAAALNCNARYLTTRFTQVVGEHMHTHLLALRVAHACGLLIRTELRVKEIAQASGFSSAGRLTKTFRRHVGVSPLEYRRVFSRTI